MLNVWRVFVFSNKYRQAFDQGRLIDTRERRRIAGEWTITLPDQINERTYPDSIVRAYSNFDTYGQTIDPYLVLEHPEKKGIGVYIPFRAMLPNRLDGILVTGLGISAHRDAVPLIRMQADIQNGGYAAGVAAAMAVETNVPVCNIDIKALQQHLVEIGNLPETVLSGPGLVSAARRQNLGGGGISETVPWCLGHRNIPHRAMPLLEVAYIKPRSNTNSTIPKYWRF
ncbi:MAG: FAD-dependent oxidoreductase [Pirellulales bacterium]|nr:FAD-dependent oxidoreductase [Pirellulales bacterium]